MDGSRKRKLRGWGCLIAAAIVSGMLALAVSNYPQARLRRSFSLMQRSAAGGRGLLQQYYQRYHTLPPRETSSTVYLPFTMQLVAPVKFHVRTTFNTGRTDTVLYEGPPLDPFRDYSLFPMEYIATAHGLAKDWDMKVKGYPLRYCRINGSALFISNGPDEDADLFRHMIEATAGGAQGHSLYEALASHRYDPTNGSFSDGDCFQVFVAEENADQK